MEVEGAMGPARHGVTAGRNGTAATEVVRRAGDEAAIQVRGKDVRTRAVEIEGRTVAVTGRWLRTAAVKDEDLVEGEVIADPDSFVARLKASRLRSDVFTFAQKLPDTEPRYRYRMEWDNLAVIRVTTFAEWWNKQVEPSVRRAVRKGAKVGVVARTATLDDGFVQGIAGIYNETPIRQGRAFWHYQKDLETVRRENGTYPDRSVLIGAYLQDELIGFLRMILVDRTASIIQILSKTKHFDKRPTNVLLAKAVELCEQNGMSHLVYCSYVYNDPSSSLTEFKRRIGFEQVLVPRYYVPLTLRGALALRLNLHRGLARLVPAPALAQLRRMRDLWNRRKAAAAPEEA
jgi:hypothetical protein